MKKLLTIVLWCLPLMVFAQQPVLVIDRIQGSESISKQFRADESRQLRASASGQFSAQELQNIFCNIPAPSNKVWVVDLRRESHGFVNGIAVSWYGERNQANKDLSPAQIAKIESDLLRQLGTQQQVIVYQLEKFTSGAVGAQDPITMSPDKVQSEQELVESLGGKYKRLYVLDHYKPDNQTVDYFIEFVRARISADDWVHFHCRGGKGRSSTFIAMFDMLKNAKAESFAQIMQRQVVMGNKDLASTESTKEKEWKQGPAKERYAFLQKFYQYSASDQGYPQLTWSEWLSKQ